MTPERWYVLFWCAMGAGFLIAQCAILYYFVTVPLQELVKALHK